MSFAPEPSSPSAQAVSSALGMGQANLARSLKSLLELSHEFSARQSAASRQLLQSGLGVIHPGMISTTRALLDVQSDLVVGLGTQWKNALDKFIDRSGACVADLREADEHDEVMGVLALYAGDLSERMHDDAKHTGKLLASVGEATKVLVLRALDEMSDDGSDTPATR